jgi:hypothetical protein
VEALKKISLILFVLVLTCEALARNVTVYNKTPYTIEIKAKPRNAGDYQGLFDSEWVKIPAGKTGQASPKDTWTAHVSGIYVKVDVPGKNQVDLGYHSFVNTIFSAAADQTAVVGVESIIEPNNSTLKGFKFFIGHILGTVDSAPAEKSIKF